MDWKSIKQVVPLVLPAVVLAGFLSGCFGTAAYRETYVQTSPGAGEYNIAELNAYGEWVPLEGYGSVWRPNVSADWQPFFYGHWAYSDGNWVWISYEPFGWIVYHYGNWYNSPEYGWVWIPADDSWSPARVHWVVYGDYVCWAPLEPRGVGWGQPWEENRVNGWVVVRSRDFTQDNIGNRRVDRAELRTENQGVRPINRMPDERMISRVTNAPVQTVQIQHQPVKVGKRQFNRMRIPETETRRVQKFQPQVDKHVFRKPAERKENDRDHRHN